MKLSPETRYLFRSLQRKWASNVTQLIAAWIIAIVAVFFHSYQGLRLDLMVMEWMYQIRGVIPPPKDVVLISIDDESFKELGISTKYPVPRKYIAAALEGIVKVSPRLLILDAKLPDEKDIDPSSEDRIEAALKELPVTIWNGLLPNAGATGKEEMIVPSAERFRKVVKMELPMTLYGAYGRKIFLSNPRVSDQDLFTRIPTARALKEIGGYSVADVGAHDLINFYGPSGAIPRISLYKLVGEIPSEVKEQLQGKILVMGHQSKFYGRGILSKDEYLTPADSSGVFGVEIHATSVGNLIEGTGLRRAPAHYEFAALFLAVLLIAAYSFRSPSIWLIAAIWTVVFVLYVAEFLAFSKFHLWMSGLGSLTIFAAISTVLSAIYLYRRAQAYKRYIDKTFNFEKQREF
jgi:adenylate cyclase